MRNEHKLLADHIGKMLKSYPVKSICDYGCGRGDVLVLLDKKISSEVPLMGIDFFAGKQKMEARNKDRLTFIDRQSDAYNKLVKNRQKFDLITLIHTVSHFHTPVREMKNLINLMDKGSYIYFNEVQYNKNTSAALTANFGVQIEEMHQEFKDDFETRRYSIDKIKDLLEVDSFEISYAEEYKTESLPEEEKKITEHLFNIYQKWHDDYDRSDEVSKKFFQTMLKMVIDLVKKYGVTDDSRFHVLAKKL